MRINELIEKLQELRNEYGNILCVTPGFDEFMQARINKVELMRVQLNTEMPSNSHYYQNYDEVKEGGELAVSLDYE